MFADAKATLVVTDMKGSLLGSAAEALRRRGARVSSFECDLADEGAVVDLTEMIRATYGRLDVIDHVAGATTGLGQDGLVTELDVDLWDSFMATNARGAMLLAKHGIPLLLAAGGGAIVFTSAGLAGFGDDQASAYGAGKGALETLARSIAAPFGKQDLRHGPEPMLHRPVLGRGVSVRYLTHASSTMRGRKGCERPVRNLLRPSSDSSDIRVK